MAQLTLRTLLAYIDDTLEPNSARELGGQVAASPFAKELIERIKVVTRRRGLKSPVAAGPDDEVSDPNTVAEYLSDNLDQEGVQNLEQTCLESDPHLAEVAACHQILSLVLTEPVRVPPRAHQRMYALVKPPASAPGRKPGKGRGVGGNTPRAVATAEPDDADAALLLGLGRYSSGSGWDRAVAAGAVVAAAGLLAAAVYLALPSPAPEPPVSSPGGLYAVAPARPEPPPAAVPDPKPPEPDAKPPEVPAEEKKEADPKPAEKGDNLVNQVPPPRAERVPIGQLTTPNVLVLTRPDEATPWARIDPARDPGIRSADPVLCLPGYKADIRLDSKVVVHLWGNIPDQFPNPRLLESRVVFHAPARKADGKGDEFAADLTVVSGRVYLSTTAAEGARVRVRFAGEVWDITLPKDDAAVMVEVTTAFEPGGGFAREGGPAPRVEARAAVVKGTAGLAAPDRFKTFDKVTAPAVVVWDSASGVVADPVPIEKENLAYEKNPAVSAQRGVAVGRALKDLLDRVAANGRVGPAVAELLTAEPEPNLVLPTQVAVYAAAAALPADGSGDGLKPLIDQLDDEAKGYARFAAVNALAGWVAKAPGNTALLEKMVAAKLRGEAGVAEVVVRLLRGAVNPDNPDPAELDRLVKYLSHPSVAVRELALWNLINFADPAAADPKSGLLADVGMASAPAYRKFLDAWAARVEEIKRRPPAKKEPPIDPGKGDAIPPPRGAKK